MEVSRLRYALPSCKVSKGLISQIEKFLCARLLRLLKKDLDSMQEMLNIRSEQDLLKMEIRLEERKERRKFSSMSEYRDSAFSPSIQKVSLNLRVGRPEVLAIHLIFPRRGRPVLEFATIRQPIKAICPAVAEGVEGIIRKNATPNRFFHYRPVQFLPAILLAAGVSCYGVLQGMHPFFVFASLGWVILLAAGLGWLLPRLFPYVSFETQHHLSLRNIALLGVFSLNLASVSGYIGLLFLEIKRFSRF